MLLLPSTRATCHHAFSLLLLVFRINMIQDRHEFSHLARSRAQTPQTPCSNIIPWKNRGVKGVKEPEIRYTCSFFSFFFFCQLHSLNGRTSSEEEEAAMCKTSTLQKRLPIWKAWWILITAGTRSKATVSTTISCCDEGRGSRTFHDTSSYKWLVDGSRKCHDFHILLGSVVTQIGALWPWQAQLYQQGEILTALQWGWLLRAARCQRCGVLSLQTDTIYCWIRKRQHKQPGNQLST